MSVVPNVSGRMVAIAVAFALLMTGLVAPASARTADRRQLPNQSQAPEFAGLASDGAVIGNGTITLGVGAAGNIDLPNEGVGLVLDETGGDALIPGCLCEGWGVADLTSGAAAWATVDLGPSQLRGEVTSFTSTATTATSVVESDGTFRITHQFEPVAGTPNLYRMGVSITNIGDAAVSPRYRRVMDWDVPPSEFYEYVTIAGSHSALVTSTNDGFASVDPREPATDLGQVGTFEDAGPDDHGALFDFQLETIEPGATTMVDLFYGAALTEGRALESLASVQASIWSLAQPPTGSGAPDGTPNTFMFGAAETSLRLLPDPASAYNGETIRLRPVGQELADADNLPFRARIIAGPSVGATAGCLIGGAPFIGCSGFFGGLSFRADEIGTSDVLGWIDTDNSGVRDGAEPSTTGRITWLDGVTHDALGDSYSSGQGAGDYDENVRVCERSDNAFGRVINAPNGTRIRTMADRGITGASLDFVACGGARTFHLLPALLGGVAQHDGVPPQMSQDGVANEDSDLLTFTIGGNDLGFTDALSFCARNDCSDPNEIYRDDMNVGDWLLNALNGVVGERLRETYEEAVSQAPDATIAVAGYPYLFPGLNEEQNCVRLTPFNNNEQNLIRGLQDVLDTRMAQIAAEVGIHYTSVLNHFAGHEICANGGAWLNGLRPAWQWPPVSGESFHPNAEGQRQYAIAIRRTLVAAIDRGADVNDAGLPVNPPPVNGFAAAFAMLPPAEDGLTESATFAPTIITPTGEESCGVVIAGDTISYSVADLAPGSTATIALQSGGTIVELEQVAIDAFGHGSGAFALPEDFLGQAVLRLTGESIIGGPAESLRAIEAAVTRPECDATAPDVVVASPIQGGVYDLGEEVVIDFSCSDVELTVCLGDQPRLDTLSTNVPGPATFSVIGQDASGNTTEVVVEYLIGPGLSIAGPVQGQVGSTVEVTVTRVGGVAGTADVPFAYTVNGVTRNGVILAATDTATVDVSLPSTPGTVDIALLPGEAYFLAENAITAITITVVSGSDPGGSGTGGSGTGGGGSPPVDTAGEGEPPTPDRSVLRLTDATSAESAAVEISRHRFDSMSGFAGTGSLATHVVLARVDEFADALAGTVLTGSGPLLYTGTSEITARTVAEIRRVLGGGGTVFVLGGTAAIDEGVEAQLAQAGYTVQRLSGPSRVETAIAVADAALARGPVDQVVIARAYGNEDNPTAAWADSITVGGHAANVGTPVLLTSAPLHPAVRTWLDAHPALGQTVVGGVAAVPESVVAALDGPARVSGPARAETAVAVAAELWSTPSTVRILINGYAVDAWTFGLLAAGVAADEDAPILLSEADALPEATLRALDGCAADQFRLVGSQALISTVVRDALTSMVDACA